MLAVAIVALVLLSLKLLLDYINAYYFRQMVGELLQSNKNRFIDMFSIAMAKEFIKRK